MNTSPTESFGIAILEAACAGLYVVSTKVGGVPEILPKDLISFADPNADGKGILTAGLKFAHELVLQISCVRYLMLFKSFLRVNTILIVRMNVSRHFIIGLKSLPGQRPSMTPS
jgi:glycosyltransferase involved in cell wall biosynthesis